MHNGHDTEPPTPVKMALPSESAEEGRDRCTESCDIARHAHEDGLRCKLKGPESHLLESSFAGLFIHDVPSKSIVGLQDPLARALAMWSQGFLPRRTGHPLDCCQK